MSLLFRNVLRPFTMIKFFRRENVLVISKEETFNLETVPIFEIRMTLYAAVHIK